VVYSGFVAQEVEEGFKTFPPLKNMPTSPHLQVVNQPQW